MQAPAALPVTANNPPPLQISPSAPAAGNSSAPASQTDTSASTGGSNSAGANTGSSASPQISQSIDGTTGQTTAGNANSASANTGSAGGGNNVNSIATVPTPQISAAADSTSSSGSSSGTTGVAGATGSSGISVSLIRPTSVEQSGIISVSVPKDMATAGNGFSFPLPAQVANTAGNNTVISVSTASGQPLPGWLTFNPETRTFVASAVPDGAFPMQVVVTIGGRSTTIVISERAQ